jgi:hypothetical protein
MPDLDRFGYVRCLSRLREILNQTVFTSEYGGSCTLFPLINLFEDLRENARKKRQKCEFQSLIFDPLYRFDAALPIGFCQFFD